MLFAYIYFLAYIGFIPKYEKLTFQDMLRRRRSRKGDAGFSLTFAAFAGIIGLLVGLLMSLIFSSPPASAQMPGLKPRVTVFSSVSGCFGEKDEKLYYSSLNYHSLFFALQVYMPYYNGFAMFSPCLLRLPFVFIFLYCVFFFCIISLAYIRKTNVCVHLLVEMYKG